MEVAEGVRPHRGRLEAGVGERGTVTWVNVDVIDEGGLSRRRPSPGAWKVIVCVPGGDREGAGRVDRVADAHGVKVPTTVAVDQHLEVLRPVVQPVDPLQRRRSSACKVPGGEPATTWLNEPLYCRKATWLPSGRRDCAGERAVVAGHPGVRGVGPGGARRVVVDSPPSPSAGDSNPTSDRTSGMCRRGPR